MKSVGIKDLKNNLSKYLRLVREGELIYVADRDEIIAEIHKPTTPSPPLVSAWEAFLNQEERRGSIRRAQKRPGSVLEEMKRKKLEPLEFEWWEIYQENKKDRI